MPARNEPLKRVRRSSVYRRRTPGYHRYRRDYEGRRDCVLSNSDGAQGDQNGQPRLFGSESRRLDPPPDKGGGFPVRYRIGQSRGHIVKHDELLETSRGDLIVSNQRLFLNPFAEHKPLSAPLSKIASFHVYENGLEVWQDDKERPYLFVLDAIGSEISGLCLDKLLRT